MREEELIELIQNYKHRSNQSEKISLGAVESFDELKSVFNLNVTFDNLFIYREAVEYIIANEIYIKTMDKNLIQNSLLELHEEMEVVYKKQIAIHYWYDEHLLIEKALRELKKKIVDICDESKYFLVHLPHYGVQIPDEFRDDYFLDEEELNKNIFEYADYDTFYLYHTLYHEFDGVHNAYSRLFFDPERFFDDRQESMQVKHGLGWFYENAILEKKPLRSTKNREAIASYYHKHHAKLNAKTKQKLRLYGKCTIIDCHSFSNTRYWFHDKSLSLPDICIGFDEFHKDDFLIETLLKEFKGYDVGLNTPYVGSLVPSEFYNRDKNVKSVMIEINKKLYLEPNSRKRSENFELIKKKIENIKDILIG